MTFKVIFFLLWKRTKTCLKKAKNCPEIRFWGCFLVFFLCVLTEISLKSHRNIFFIEIHGCTAENRLFQEKTKKCGSARGCFLVCIRSTWCPNGTKKTTPKHLFFLGRGGSAVPASPFVVLFYWLKQTNKTPKRRSRSSPARRVESSRRINSKSTFTGHCLPHSNDQSPEKLRGVFLQQTHRVTEDGRRKRSFCLTPSPYAGRCGVASGRMLTK